MARPGAGKLTLSHTAERGGLISEGNPPPQEADIGLSSQPSSRPREARSVRTPARMSQCPPIRRPPGPRPDARAPRAALCPVLTLGMLANSGVAACDLRAGAQETRVDGGEQARSARRRPRGAAGCRRTGPGPAPGGPQAEEEPRRAGSGGSWVLGSRPARPGTVSSPWGELHVTWWEWQRRQLGRWRPRV